MLCLGTRSSLKSHSSVGVLKQKSRTRVSNTPEAVTRLTVYDPPAGAALALVEVEVPFDS